MDGNIVFTNLTELKTPVGIITVDGLNEHIPFDVIPGTFSSDYEVYSEDNKTILSHIFADGNYEIRIPTKNLKIGMRYMIKYDGGKLRYNTGDEHTISLTGTFGDYSFGLGAYDPNDAEKMEQACEYSERRGYLAKRIIQEPEKYDISNFVCYELEVLGEMSGYSFRLIDRNLEYIFFPVAWIQIDAFDSDTYESAVDFWIS